MPYTVISEAEDGPVTTTAPSVIDALFVAQALSGADPAAIRIAADDGWELTVDELEELARA
ncbi:hypothetical protein GCM10008171_28200 [Methylopila jiangsuensis]|uniref:Uncharacterized protein n=1 Tax=Methylopila jiangsuensis TaxID=586230 RepID=A0A9W6JH69_9HYPH|nr:hypothetical protein [Methylopila jiangsuensis]MDR6285045.1 hypothetical protein [Methylopila jiangsuensis]GLK77566.1 hypothetical protein GCM10008171_28200 [Methylopila jiangsuensis]